LPPKLLLKRWLLNPSKLNILLVEGDTRGEVLLENLQYLPGDGTEPALPVGDLSAAGVDPEVASVQIAALERERDLLEFDARGHADEAISLHPVIITPRCLLPHVDVLRVDLQVLEHLVHHGLVPLLVGDGRYKLQPKVYGTHY